MAKGSCLCEELKYSFTGEPVMQAICHCLTCRKLTGSAYTTILLVPSSSFAILAGSENIKTYTKKHESGLILQFSFCKNCGTTIYKEGLDSKDNEGMFIVMAGTLDEGMELKDVKVGAELFVKHRVEWLSELQGAAQCQEFS